MKEEGREGCYIYQLFSRLALRARCAREARRGTENLSSKSLGLALRERRARDTQRGTPNFGSKIPLARCTSAARTHAARPPRVSASFPFLALRARCARDAQRERQKSGSEEGRRKERKRRKGKGNP